MGESFIGIPNRLRAYGTKNTDFNYNNPVPDPSTPPNQTLYPTEMDKKYNPNHALSAYYGYLISKLYVNRAGGQEFAMSGPLRTVDILPRSQTWSGGRPPDIGSKNEPYYRIYAHEFIGNVSGAGSLSTPRKIKVSLKKADNDRQYSGEANFDGSSDIEISVWTPFLHINGGTVNGSTTFGGEVTCNSFVTINDTVRSKSILPNVGQDIVNNKIYQTNYTIGSTWFKYLSVHAKEFHGSLIGNANTATRFNTPVKITVDVDATHAASGSAVLKGDEGDGVSGDSPLFHSGIRIQTSAKGYVPSTGGTITGPVEMLGQVKGKGAGSQWYNGRDNAAFRNSKYSGYTPLTSMMAKTGSWEFGPYLDEARLIYISDYNYNNSINERGAQYTFGSDGKFTASVLQGSHTGTFTGSATFTDHVKVLHSKSIRFIDTNDRVALKIWCGDDGDGNENRYLHFTCTENEGWVSSACYAHFDRAYGFFNSRVPFRGDHGILGSLRTPKRASDCSTIIVGDVDDSGNDLPPYFEYDFGTGVKITDDSKSFIPTSNNTMTLGNEDYKWKNVWAVNGSIQTSDRNLKEQIGEIPDVFKKVYANLLPVVYHWSNGGELGDGHDRQHAGFISQDVENALLKNGLTPMDFSGLCIDEVYPRKRNPFYGKTSEERLNYIKKHPEAIPEDKTIDCSDEYLDEKDMSKEKIKRYSIRPEQFIPLNTFMIQQLMAKVDELEVLLGIKDELEYPELADSHRYDQYNKK